jgi:hypothetical protein
MVQWIAFAPQDVVATGYLHLLRATTNGNFQSVI